MSILLDAVTRAKQQDQLIDPVITPRAQYQAMNQGRHLGLKISLFILFLLLAVVLAWLFSRASPLGEEYDTQVAQAINEPSVNVVDKKAPQTEPSRVIGQVQTHQTSEKNTFNEVQLAGKVALPVAIERPRVERYGAAENFRYVEPSLPKQNVAKGSKTIAVATQANDGDFQEPIILGANSNQRGEALLSSLKSRVNEAAQDLGLERSQPKNVSNDLPSNNLVAAFEAALKEVEKDNAVAKPVTEPKLDPIPQPQPDELPKYGQLPAGVQLQVPEFNILAHVYASDPNNRWLNVDGAELQQGDMIDGKLTIVEIRPRDVVLEVAGTQFKVPAI
ncbi:general secretion pathway protein GspB [Shewanella psychrotolerans]|uniref:general secretion pathway protein GspB n=1 Tax=Shewanella psychrotolerans TaxID=2864206 RepID=UPI001C655CC4|nr:general secretion pathway protein GspB [Shewanella psychrotolerans]QYK00692.1 general secretion pathway protein GspB [Shewanella psychrotolerans]